MENSRKKTRECAYCGSASKLTKDHVIPRCLFPRPLPPRMLTVPACETCNATKSKHDGFFRDILVTDVQGAESLIAERVFQERTISSHVKGKSLLARIALTEGTERPLFDENGAIRGILPQFSVDSKRMHQTFEFLVRGLRYSIDGFRLVDHTKFISARLLFDERLQGTIDVLDGIRFTGPMKVGEGVFECYYAIAEDEPNGSIWLLCFYDRVVYRIVTRARKR